MASYFCSLKEWTTSELSATGSIIGKETEEPSAPSEATLVKQNAVGKKNVGNFNVPTLAGGEVVVAATLHVYAKVAAEGKSLKVAFVSPAVSGEPNVKVASAWLATVSLSKAQAEALTQATLNTLACQLEIILSKSTSIYEVYLALETTTGTTPTTITLAAAAGESATSAAVSAQTQVPLSAAAGDSATSAALKAQTTVPLAAAAGDSASSASLTARTTVTLAAAAGTSSTANLPLEAAKGPVIALTAALAESSSATLPLKAQTVLVLAPAAAESAATATVTVPAPMLVGSGGAEVLVGAGGSTAASVLFGAGGGAGTLSGMGGKG